jgi:hypothetical protein
MVLCLLVFGNLLVQVSGLDRTLQMTQGPLIHVKCFANMPNLVSAWTVSTPHFSRIMDHLADLQKLLTSPPATAQLGVKCKCPTFAQTRWFDMVDTLPFISNHFAPVSEFLCNLSDDAAIPRFLPWQIFQFYLILLPFSWFTEAVERRSCS